ncbi:hypothetical protein K461DRAFT_310985 [Myriangium duriaei CBS 260.36]|uniref:SnoaL-like domain-containing protein n=1 Tax=Myriangium duriaei CBS 260.36 TaxID=1168546 RepID=A0A9P4MPB7_9PEZI|nr:hypothetical protein K461DRAFT_310985 [Myriangium duriaei CBS 260.36]
MSAASVLQQWLDSIIALFYSLFYTQPAHSRRMQTAYRVFDAYNSLSVDNILRPMDSSFTHQVLPASLGMPTRSRDDFAKHAAGITSVFEIFAIEPVHVFEDVGRNAVIAYARMVGKLARGMGEWENEVVFIMRFSEDGERVVGIQEFVDSAKAKMMREKMAPKNFG